MLYLDKYMNRFAKTCAIVSLFLLFWLPAKAFDSVLPWTETGYNVTFPEGMSSRTNYKVVKDSNGFLWIATSNGVERYDGMSFRHYNLGKSRLRTINDGFQVSIIIDQTGTLWTFTERSIICRYDPDTDEFVETLALHDLDLPGSVRSLYSNGKDLILGLNDRIVRLDIEKRQVISTNYHGHEIRNIEVQDDNHLLLGTTQGIWMYDLTNDTVNPLSCAGIDINYLHYDSPHHLLWIGSRGLGLYYIQHEEWDNPQAIGKADNYIINVIKPLNKDVMLVGTDGNGLLAYPIEKQSDDRFSPASPLLVASESLSAPCQMPNSVVDDILVDGPNLWVTMDLSGLALLQPKDEVSSLINPLAKANADRNALDVSIDKDGRYWIAFPRCIVCYDRPNADPKIYLEDVSGYLTILAADDGSVWCGGYNAGLYHLYPETQKYEFFPSVVGQKVLDCVYALCEDRNHDIWVGGLNFDLTRMHRNCEGQYDFKTFPDVRMITDIRMINKDTIVAGTFDGLWLIDTHNDHTERLLMDKEKWPYTNAIASIADVSDHELWLGTMGAGLAHYDLKTHEATLYTYESSLPSTEIRGVEMLNDSVLCASTEKNGIFAFDIHNHHVIRTLRHTDGKMMGIFSRSSSGSSIDGHVAFGSDNGVIAINTEDIVTKRDTFRIFAMGDNLEGNFIHLPANNRSLDLQFTTNDLYHQIEYRFEYVIKGLSQTWETMDESRRLRYLSLPPGEYEICVRSFSATSLTGELNLKVVVDCEWWLRWYCILFYILSAIGLIWFVVHHYRIKHMSETDALTGINNRYAGQMHVSEHLQNHVTGVFVLLDCDKFKLVNDTYGHMVGDKLLIRVARALSNTFPNKTIMRLGGDEFAFYLTGTYTSDELRAEADRLIKAVEEIRIGEMGNYVPSISMGAAFYNGKDKMTFEQVYTEADRRLYESKKHEGCWITC